MKIRILMLLACALASQANATTITFNGVVTTAFLWGDYATNYPAAQVGDTITGSIFVYPNSPLAEINVGFPNGTVIGDLAYPLNRFPGGVSLFDDSASGDVGFDNFLSLTILFNGGGSFEAGGSFFEDIGNLNPTTDFDQFYTGDIVSVSGNLPESGTSLGLFALACFGLYFFRIKLGLRSSR